MTPLRGGTGAHPVAHRRSIRLLTALLCLSGIVLPLLVTSAAPASAATAQADLPPHCPPDCGAVAAGDPLLVPFMTFNPGVNWQAFPAAVSQSYVESLQRNIGRLAGGSAETNVAVAQWRWVTRQYSLRITLVSSTSLARVRLQKPMADASDLCRSSGGFPSGAPTSIPGIPGSVSATCVFRPGSSLKSASVTAFVKGNVVALLEIDSRSNRPLTAFDTTPAAHQQYLALPVGGVPVSNGGLDIEWLVFWLCLMAALAAGIVGCARRRGSWRGPFVAVAEALGRRKVALVVSLAGVIAAMAFSMLGSTVMRGFGAWWGVASFGDFWQNWADAAHTTFAGGYGHIYVLDRTLETAPALQVIVAPIARLAFHLPFPYPSDVLYPKAFWVAGPLFVGGIALPICAGDRWLNGMGVTDLRRRLTVLGLMAFTLAPIPLSGHPEDLIALGAMLYGIAAAFDGRARATGWWLGVALAFQPFAFLAVPIALIFLTRRQWLTSIGRIVVVPVAFLVVPLVADPRVTLSTLLHQKVYDVFGYIGPTWNLDPGVAAYIRLAVALAAIPAALILARFLPKSRRRGAALVMWAVAVLFALRVFEPELFPYFLAPALALAPLSAARRPWWRLGTVAALAIWLTWWLHFALHARWSMWLLLAGQLCVLGALAYPGRPSANPDGLEGDSDTRTATRPDRALVNR